LSFMGVSCLSPFQSWKVLSEWKVPSDG
jgi:hypothetical protein